MYYSTNMSSLRPSYKQPLHMGVLTSQLNMS